MSHLDLDLFDDYIGYLKDKDVAFADRFIPYYLCSIGSHMLNLKQQKSKIYASSGSYDDLRMNIMMVAPPGFGKSFFIKLMLDPEIGILGGTSIPTHYAQILTEAGFVGTEGGEGVEEGDGPSFQPGLAYDYRNGIVGCEEFDTLIQAMQTQHSSNLDNALLTALDDGRVRKRLANETIEYDTALTMFAGTQPVRMDLTSGLGRRFMFVKFFPSPEEIEQLRQSRRAGRGQDADYEKIQKYKDQLGKKLDSKVSSIEGIHGIHKLDPIFDDQAIPHFEEPIYERMAMGYSVMKKDTLIERGGDTLLEIEVDDTLTELVVRAIEWRRALMKDVEGEQVLSVLRGTNGQQMKLEELQEWLQKYSMDYSQSQGVISRLRKNKQVKFKKGKDGTTVKLNE